jgi:predicted methyltransferase
MRTVTFALALGLMACTAPIASAAPRGAASAAVAAAVADPARPDKDRARDAARKPAEMLAFAEVKPGDTVVDLVPGGGYFTRIFAKAVGPKGHVYAVLPQGFEQLRTSIDPVAAAYPNVSVVVATADMAANAQVDVVWTAQNYHDLRGAGDMTATNKAVFAVLKPGGVYVVLDHAAAPGSGVRDINSLHRIDPAAVRAEVEAAGFRFDGESTALRNPADTHTAKVFDPAIRGHTDQFILKFRKPR